QDLILAQRVKGYRAGELERRYPRLPIEEAFFINYGFLPRETLALLHPRDAPSAWDAGMRAGARKVLAFVREHGYTRPKDVQAHFDHGRMKRWGGDLNVSSHLLERPALSRTASRGAARCRHPDLPGDRACAAGRQRRGQARARRPAAGYGRAAL